MAEIPCCQCKNQEEHGRSVEDHAAAFIERGVGVFVERIWQLRWVQWCSLRGVGDCGRRGFVQRRLATVGVPGVFVGEILTLRGLVLAPSCSHAYTRLYVQLPPSKPFSIRQRL